LSAETLKPIAPFPDADSGGVMAWSPDGDRLASFIQVAGGPFRSRLAIFDINSQKLTVTASALPSGSWIAWNGDGTRVWTVSNAPTKGPSEPLLRHGKIWDATSGKELISVDLLPFSPGLANGGGNGDEQASIIDRMFNNPLRSNQRFVRSYDGAYIAAVSLDEAQIWDFSGKKIATLPGGGFCWCGNANRALTYGTGGENTATIWELPAGKVVRRLPGILQPSWNRNTSTKIKRDTIFTPSTGNQISCSANGQYLASVKYPGVSIWDVANVQEDQVILRHGESVAGMASSPDGHWLASVGYDQAIKIWNLATRAEAFCFRGVSDRVTNLAWSKNGQFLAFVTLAGDIQIWDARKGKDKVFLSGPREPAEKPVALAWRPDGRQIASLVTPSGAESQVWIWDVETAKPIIKKKAGTKRLADYLAWSPDGKYLAMGPRFEQTLPIWNTETWQIERLLNGHLGMLNLSWSPVGQKLAFSASAGVRHDVTIQRWDGSGNPMASQLRGHTGPVTSLAWSPNGRRLATVAVDKTIRI